MAEIRNLDWLLDRLKFFLNVNEGQTDQDYVGPSTDTDKWYRDLINQAGDAEVVDAKQEGSHDWFRKTYQSTWAASAVTLAIPDAMRYHTLEELLDVTTDVGGAPLPFAAPGQGTDVFWKDNETLQWGVSGPSQATTLRWNYIANFVSMTAGSDEPELVAPQFRWLLIWSALDIAKTLGDERVPKDHQRHLLMWRERWHKHLSLGRPQRNNTPRIRNRDPDYSNTYGY